MSIITNVEDIVATDDAQAHVAEPAQRLNVAREADENTVAMVAGQPFVDVPTDLYIPPEALEVFLETFEGPFGFAPVPHQASKPRYFAGSGLCHYRPIHELY